MTYYKDMGKRSAAPINQEMIMKVKAIETGTEYELTAIDAASGTEWTRDLLGNAGAQFERNDDDEIVAPLVEIEWWLPVIADRPKPSWSSSK